MWWNRTGHADTLQDTLVSADGARGGVTVRTMGQFPGARPIAWAAR
jgi:hypothetical protein